ncbi:MAG: hypothetical protein WAV78_20630, partial [Xanthobacteraceae bacterium]
HTTLRPVAIAVAFAVPPCIAVDVAVALASPVITGPKPPNWAPPVASATANPPLVALAFAVAPPAGKSPPLPPVA